MIDLPEPDRIDMLVQDYMQVHSIPGLSLAVVRKSCCCILPVLAAGATMTVELDRKL
jgi:hypothetical protein